MTNNNNKIKSDGGSTSYYDLPEGATTLNDLIEHKGMSFALGNIFKAAYRLGEKDGATALYDINKIIYFAERMKAQAERKQRRQLPLGFDMPHGFDDENDLVNVPPKQTVTWHRFWNSGVSSTGHVSREAALSPVKEGGNPAGLLKVTWEG